MVSPIWWNNGTFAAAGAATWGNGSTGITGAVSSSNSLVGTQANDMVGGQVTALSNGNYVVGSYSWANGTGVRAGAATWGNGTSGITGTISTANSLVGTTANDMVGLNGVIALSDGRAMVGSSSASSGTPALTGAGRVDILDGGSGSGGATTLTNPHTFALNPTGKSTLLAGDVTALLNAGTAVTLQANNDITVSTAVTANNTNGNGGALTLQAGRSIALNASITTDNGNFTAVAGDPGAIAANRDAGTSTLTVGSGASINAGTGVATLVANGGNFVNNSGSATPITAARTFIYSSSPATDTLGGMTLANKHYNQSYTADSVPSYATSGDWFFYSIAPVLSVTPSLQTVTYGDVPAAFTAASYTGFIGGDSAGTAGISGTAAFTVGGATSTSGKATAGSHDVAYSSGLLSSLGYGFTDNVKSINELTVNPKTLTGSITASSSTYGAALVPGTVNLTGVVANGLTSDVVNTAAVAVNTAGNTSSSGNLKAKVGAYTGIQSVSSTLSGADAANYSFAGATGDYTVNKLDLGGSIAAGSSTYGATLAPGAATLTGRIAGDAVAATIGVTTAPANLSTAGKLKAGGYNGIETVTGLTGADAGNYSYGGVTAGNYTVSKLDLNGSIASGNSSYGATLAPGAASFSNKVGSDDVTATVAVTVAPANTSGAGKLKADSYTGIETVSGLIGTDAGNYTYGGVTAGNYTVSKLALTGSITEGNSTYGAALVPGAATLTGKLTGDDVSPAAVTINTAGNTSTSGNLKAGSYNGIQGVSAISGADSGNYSFSAVNGNYTVAKLDLGGTIAAGSSTYGATLAPGAATLTGKITGDVVAATVVVNTAGNTSTSGNLKAKVGAYSGIETVSGLTGTDAGNYTYSAVTAGNYTVNQAALSGSISTGNTTYGDALVPGSVNLTGVIRGDVITTPTASVNTEGNTSSSGNLKAGHYTGIQSVASIGGADAGNYSFAGVTGDYTVALKALAVTGVSAADKVYDGNNVATLSGAAVTPIALDVVNVTAGSGTFADANAGERKAVTATGFTLSGTDAANYLVTQPSGLSATISQALLTVTANKDGKFVTEADTSGYGGVSYSGFVNGETSSVLAGTLTITRTDQATAGAELSGTHSGVLAPAGLTAGNYSISFTAGDYIITPAGELLVSAGKNSTTYGTAASYTISAKYMTGGRTISTLTLLPVEGQANTWHWTDGAGGTGTLTLGVDSPSLSTSGTLKAGNYGVTSSNMFDGEVQNFSTLNTTGSLTVNPKTLTGNITPSSSIYGAALVPGAVSLTGVITNDVVNTAAVAVNTTGNTSSSGNLKVKSGLDPVYVGIQSVGSTLSGADAANYSFAGATGNYTVTQAPLGGTIAAGSSTYGATLAPGAATLTGRVAGDAVAATVGFTTEATNRANLSTAGKLKAGGYTSIETVTGLTGTDAGNYSYGGVTAGNYTVSKLDLNGSVAAGNSTYGATLAPGAASFSNKVGADDVTATVTIDTSGKTSGATKLKADSYTGIESVTGLTGTDAGNYTFGGVKAGDYTVSKLALGGSIDPGNSTYGAALVPGVARLTGKLTGDDVSPAAVTINTAGNTSTSGNLKAGSYNGIQGVSAISGADAGNYSFGAVSGDYTVAKLDLGGSIAAGSSTYGATLAPGAATLTGKITGDVVTATVAVNTTDNTSTSRNLKAGAYTGIETVSALTGTDAGNYTYSAVMAGNYTVNQAALGGTIATGNTTYGDALVAGTATLTGKVAGDDVSPLTVVIDTSGKTSASGNLKAGNYTGIQSVSAITGNDAANYTFSAVTGDYDVARKSVTASATGVSKTYDTTTSMTGVALGLTGGVTRDDVTVSGSGAFASKNVGTNLEYRVGQLALSGADAGNYVLSGGNSLSGSNGVITKADLTVSGLVASNKVYDATTSAPLSGTATVTPLPGDVVALGGSTVGNFADGKNVGVAKPVTVTGTTLTGPDAGNYRVIEQSGLSADVTQASLTVSGLIASNKVYDTSTVAALSGTAVVRPLLEDSVSVSGTASGAFDDKYVGTGKAVTVTGNTLSGTDALNYRIVQQSGLKADITPANITVSGLVADNKVYDTTVTAFLSGTASVTPLGTDQLSVEGIAIATFADKNVGTGKAVTVTGNTLGGVDARNYTIVQQSGLSADITKADLVVAGLSAASKIYDTRTSVVLTGSATITPMGEDSVTLSGTPVGTFADKNAGSAKAVTVTGNTISGTDAGNYNLIQAPGLSADISQASLTVSGLLANNRVYDASTNAPLSGTASVSALEGDSVSVAGTAVGTFADKNVGTGKTVTLSGVTLSGADAANYSITPTATTTADITAKSISLNGFTAASKVYDASTTASISNAGSLSGVISGDAVTASNSGASFANKNVGTGKNVTLNGVSLSGADGANYSIAQSATTTADITAKAISLNGFTAASKVYDASTTASISNAGSLSGVVAGDTVVASNSGASFANKNVGTGKAVTLSGVALGGADAANYSIAQSATTTADITAKALSLSGFTAASKVYDATTTASITNVGSLTGVLSGDTVTASNSGASFANKNVGTGKNVTLSGVSLAGADAANYSIAQSATTTADITAKPVSVSGLLASNKTFDGSTVATLTGTPTVVALAGDSLSVGGTPVGAFADSRVGTDKAVTVSGNTLSGTDAPNYKLLQQAGLKANIDNVPFTPVTEIFQTIVNAPVLTPPAPVVQTPVPQPGINLNGGLAFVDVATAPAGTGTGTPGEATPPSAALGNVPTGTSGFMPVFVVNGGIRMPGQTDN